MIVIKSPEEIAQMREAGRIVATVLHELSEEIKPGVTTQDLDKIAAQLLVREGAKSPFKDYRPSHTHRPFPGTTCMSINEEIVHGVPSSRRLKEGDILSVDCGASFNDWIADSAWTFPVGRISGEAQDLLDATEEALHASIAVAMPGSRTGDVASAMQQAVESYGYNVIRRHTSHGVGRDLHEDPQILNHGHPGKGPRLRRGMTIALEPMVLAGHYDTEVLDDSWTVVSRDGSLTAHFEHTVAVADGEPEILTKI